MFYKDSKIKREKIRRFIRENPKATYKDIRGLGIKVEKVYSGGMGEVFRDAGVKPPRTFKIKTPSEKRKIIIDYIRKHSTAGGHLIRKETKINFLTIFKSTKEAFDVAGVVYPQEKNQKLREEKKREIIELVKEDPLITINEIMNRLHTKPYNFFTSFDEIYKKAEIDKIGRSEKRSIKKRKKVISFIKQNPLASQRDINKNCKTHVQELFKRGIFEAYQKANIKFPFERLKLHGASTRKVKKRAKDFERIVSIKLSGYGKVNRLVKTKRGVADVIFERKGRKAIVEIKDYKAKDISSSQVKQLNRYLEDCHCNLGILICHKKPRKDTFLIGENKVFILNDSELNKIPQIMCGDVV